MPKERLVEPAHAKLVVSEPLGVPTTKKAAKKGNLRSKPKVEESIGETVGRRHVIYIGHLPSSFVEHPLRRYIEQFGAVENLVLSRSSRTGRPRGYGFVEFWDAETAGRVAQEVHGLYLDGRSLVAHVVPPSKVHTRMFLRKDQKLRIATDRTRRLEGYIKKPARDSYRSLQKLNEALNHNIQSERRCNERLKALGIAYSFHGFQSQAS